MNSVANVRYKRCARYFWGCLFVGARLSKRVLPREWPSKQSTYMAHVGGFMAGILMANALIVLKVADCGEADLALVEVLRPSLLIAGAAGTPDIIAAWQSA